MPIEIRHMIFSEDEIYAALEAHSAGNGRWLPAMRRLTISGGDRPVVTLVPQAGKKSAAAELHFSGEHLSSALLLLCHKKRIPLPTRGVKEVVVLDGRLTLVVKVGVGASSPAARRVA